MARGTARGGGARAVLRRVVAGIAAVGCVAQAGCVPSRDDVLVAPASDEILWDEWGVPHVYGTSHEALFRGFGRAQARSHGDLVLRLYGQARGRAAEYWGADFLDSDRWIRTMGVPERAERWLAEQDPEHRRLLEAFAAGFNEYARANPDAIADDVEGVLPVSATDLLAHAQQVLHLTFVSNAGMVEGLRRALSDGAAASGAGDGTEAGGRLAGPGGSPAGLPGRPASIGSNAWAVSPSRSESGNALLVANPHLPWDERFLFYEAHLVGPGVDLTGATLVGVPTIAIGFNDRLGWTHTVNTYDGVDAYLLTLSGDGYVFDGEVRPFAARVDTLRVRTGRASFREEVVPVRESVHGPVVAEAGGRAVALRVAGLDAPAASEQWWRMGLARDLDEFTGALEMLQVPMFNVVYADADGHTLYLFNGRVPDRPGGDVDDWAGLVPGDTSGTLWEGVLPYGALPSYTDPPSGWLQNANDPPWTSTFPRALDPAAFPEWLAPRFMHFRAQRSAGMLAADERMGFGEVVEDKHSTRMLLADRVLDDLVPLAASAGDPRVRHAGEVLERWDRNADAGSRGAVLFLAWAEEWLRGSGDAAWATPWSPEEPLETPRGIADPGAAVEALSKAAAEVEDAWGALDVPWGDVNRLRVGGADLPGNGAPGDPGGVFRVVAYRPTGDGRRVAVGGDSYVAVVEFGDPVRAMSLMSYGNASQPGSPHVGDQTRLFSVKELRPVWRAREDVEAHTVRREPF